MPRLAAWTSEISSPGPAQPGRTWTAVPSATILRPTNVGVLIEWSAVFQDRFEGAPLKRIALSLDGRTVRGEAIVTRAGLEGGGIYALSAPIRAALETGGEAILHIDLRPDLRKWRP